MTLDSSPTGGGLALCRLALILVLSLAAVNVWAQDEETEGAGLFFDAVDVTVVNVDVYVTDKNGQPVGGLTADDFELAEDGTIVPITNFFAVMDRERQGVEADAAAEGEPLETGESLDREPPPDRRLREARDVPPEQQLSLVLYFDNLHLAPHSRAEVIRHTRTFLHGNVAPGDRVMLVTFERSIHVRQPFTTDLTAIGDALFELETLTGFAQARATERRDVIRRIQRAESVGEADAFVGSYADSAHHDVMITIDALKEMVASLAGLPGRKALVYISDGVPMSAAEDLYMLVDQQFPNEGGFGNLEANRYRVRPQFRELTARANANRVTFYTIDARGLRAMTRGSAADRGSSTATMIDIDSIKLSNHHETLERMAFDTGGIAILSAGDIAGQMDLIGRDFESYYSLGYQPRDLGAGRYHDLKVKVKGRRGLTVRHRRGYRSKSPETLAHEGTLAALLYGVEQNPLAVEVGTEGLQEGEGGNVLVSVAVRVPIRELTLVPQAGRHRGRILVSVGVVNEDGELSSVTQQEIPIDVPEAELENARKQKFVYAADLLMKPGTHRLAAGVRDQLSGETSFVSEYVSAMR